VRIQDRLKNRYDVMLYEKKLLMYIYEAIDMLEIDTAYEGFIERLGDTVLTYNTRENCIIDQVLGLTDTKSDVLRTLFSRISFKDIRFFCCGIVDGKLVWGVL